MKFLITVFLLLLVAGLVQAQTTQSTNNEIDAVGEKLDAAKADVEKFKTVWDKARLETTLYDQREKRAYQKWVKATKTTKVKAQAVRDKADLELLLSIERRKLAFSQWHSAQLREASQEAHIAALAQDQEIKAIQDKIKQLETKLSPLVTPAITPKH